MSEQEYTIEELVAWLKQDAQFSEEHARRKYAIHPSALELALSECAKTEAAADKLAAAPVREERVGKCWCVTTSLGSRVFMNGEWSFVSEYAGGYAYVKVLRSGEEWCPRCGARLGADGVARRWKERGAK